MEKNLVKRVSVLGVPVDCVAREDMENVLLELLENGESNQIVFLDLQALLKARRNEEFRQALHDAALVLPLTKSIEHGVKFLYGHGTQRYLPYDFIIATLTILERKPQSVYLLGATKKIIQKADRNLKASFPKLLFVGRHSGYFKKDELDLITEAIRKSSPTLLLCGRGLKGEDRWLYRLNERFNPGISIYQHDVFDIIAGKKARPNKAAFDNGSDRFIAVLKKPWRIFRFLTHLRYSLLLFYYRSKEKR